MNPLNRTLAFLLTAICSVGVAYGVHQMYQPSVESQKTDVGTAFYPDFNDPSTATSLLVAAFNDSSNKVDQFSVEKRDGQWRIPSHHNYPADGRERLARTAASIIGVTRGQLVDTSSASHARLKLLDPLNKDITNSEGVGSRITLKAGDQVLTDLIIGKKDDAPGTDRYYVRRADEDRVYLAEVRPELSTKFTDWIQPNVLDATAANFRRLEIDRYSVDEAKGTIVQGDKSLLTRGTSTEDWKLDGVPAGQKVKTSVVNQIVSSLSDTKIVGVRPKTPGVAALVKGDAKARLSPVDQLDMQEKGYFISNNGLVSNEGDVLAGTSEGIVYVLRFGELVGGEEIDIEIGSSKKLTEEEAKAELEKKKAGGEASATDAKPAAEGDKKDGEAPKKQNRFLFVTVQLDEKLLGEAPVEPVKPTPPPGYKPKEKPADAKKDSTPIPGFDQDDQKKATPPAAEKKETSLVAPAPLSLAGPGADPVQEPTETKPATPPADPAAAPKQPDAAPQETKPATDPAPPATAPAPAEGGKPAATPQTESPKDPFAEYEAELAKYEQAYDEYKVRKAEYDEKLEKARKREKALNARFADWYYVISAEVFDTINVKPADLIEPESTPAATGAGPGAGLPAGLPPGLQIPGLGGLQPPPAAPATPATDAPKSETPPAETPKGEEKKSETGTKPETPPTEPAATSPPPSQASEKKPE